MWFVNGMKKTVIEVIVNRKNFSRQESSPRKQKLLPLVAFDEAIKMRSDEIVHGKTSFSLDASSL